jgi:tripartite-type tricarboxylate transporter receptor subunit TctC
MPSKTIWWAALCLAAAAPSGASGQTGPDFYANKQIRMIIGHPPGNDYDLAARFLAKYLVRHIPGEPTIIAQNMPQAASITAANFSSVELGRPYVLPPGTPKERVDVMRKAFAETVHDPELIAEADRLKLDMTYRSPQDLERLVTNLYQTPPEMVETVKKLVPNLQ